MAARAAAGALQNLKNLGEAIFECWPQAWESLIVSGFPLLSSLETSFASSSSPSLLHGGLGFRKWGKKSDCSKLDAGNCRAFRFPRICKTPFWAFCFCRALSVRRPLRPRWHLPWGSKTNVVYSLAWITLAYPLPDTTPRIPPKREGKAVACLLFFPGWGWELGQKILKLISVQSVHNPTPPPSKNA